MPVEGVISLKNQDAPERSLGRVTRRPAVAAAILLTLGICLHDRVPLHPQWYLLESAALVLLAALSLRRSTIASIFICGLIILLGIGIAQREYFQFLF